MENEIIFQEEQRINALHFEDKHTFAKYVYYFQQYCNGMEDVTESASLIEEDELIDFSKNCLLIWDLFQLNLSDKKLINAISKYVQKEINSDMESLKKIHENCSSNLRLIQNALMELPFEIELNEDVTIMDFMKIVGLKIVDYTSQTLLDKVLKIIDIVKFVDEVKLIIFVNLKSFFREEELVEIYKYAVYNEINLLCLENTTVETVLKYEHIIFIDKDFEEFVR